MSIKKKITKSQIKNHRKHNQQQSITINQRNQNTIKELFTYAFLFTYVT